jgi:hypothetical protein
MTAPMLAVGLLVAGPALRDCPLGPVTRLGEPQRITARRPRRSGGLAPALALGMLLAAALWMAPEAPQDQAAICQRHNGVAACRVW